MMKDNRKKKLNSVEEWIIKSHELRTDGLGPELHRLIAKKLNVRRDGDSLVQA